MYEINLNGEIGENQPINLDFVSSELEKANGQDLQVTINTIGGEVETAFEIYNLLEKYKIDNKAIVTTITDKECASSGVILLLAGNRRIVNKNTEPFVHEAMRQVRNDTYLTANELINAGFEVEDVSFQIAKLYAEKTRLDYDEARGLMKQNTFLTPEESYSLGFATELSKIYNVKENDIDKLIKSKLNNNNMNKEESSLFEEIKNWFSKVNKNSIVNKIELTVSGDEVNFPDLSPDDNPKIGDQAFVDGKPAELEYRMKNGRKYVFADGKLDRIFEPGEDDPEMDQLKNDLESAEKTVKEQKVEISNLKDTVKGLKKSIDESKEIINKFAQFESKFEEISNKKEQRETKTNDSDDDDFDVSDVNTNLKKLK